MPLKPPVFECRSGHRACGFCADYNSCICPGCGEYEHIPWLDPCLMAAKVPCPNKRFGCPNVVAYGMVEGHLLECPHGPCRCPDCGFLGSPPMLYGHLKENHHGLTITTIAIDTDLELKIHEAERRRVLATEDGKHLFLLVISERVGGGREVRVVSARAKDFDPWRYWCKAWTMPPLDPENGCGKSVSRLEDRARSCPVLSEAAAIAVGGKHLTVHLLDMHPGGGGFDLTVSITRYQLETAAGAAAPASALWM